MARVIPTRPPHQRPRPGSDGATAFEVVTQLNLQMRGAVTAQQVRAGWSRIVPGDPPPHLPATVRDLMRGGWIAIVGRRGVHHLYVSSAAAPALPGAPHASALLRDAHETTEVPAANEAAALSLPAEPYTPGAAHRLGTTDAMVFDVWTRATLVNHRAMSSRELAACWAQFSSHPKPRALATIASDLTGRGLFVRAGFRCGYVYATCVSKHVLPSCDHAAIRRVRAALHAAETRHGPWVTAALVRAELSSADAEALPGNAVTWLMATLVAEDGAATEPGEGVIKVHTLPGGPEIRRLFTATDAPLPADVNARAARMTRPASRRAAAIRTVEAARAALGVPPCRVAWKLFLAAHLRDDAELAQLQWATPFRQLRSALLCNKAGDAARTGRRYTGLTRIYIPRGGLGYTRPRMALAPVSEAELHAVALLDAITWLRPAAEYDSLQDLDAWWLSERAVLGDARGAADAVIERICAARRTAFVRALESFVPEAQWLAAMERVGRYAEVLQQWAARSGRSESEIGIGLRKLVRDPLRGGRALVRWLETEHARCRPGAGAVDAGNAGGKGRGRPLDAVPESPAWSGPELRSLLHLVPSSSHELLHVEMLAGARASRLAGDGGPPAPPPEMRQATRSAAGPSGRVVVARDRLDVWGVVLRTCGGPYAQDLLRDAEVLLGPVLRDGQLLAECLADTPLAAHGLQSALIVAAGALGSRPSAAVIARAHAAADARAVLLATLLADPHEAEANVRALVTAWTERPHARAAALSALVAVCSDEPLMLVE